MPRGGARPGAGRKPDPNSARQKKAAAKLSKAAAAGHAPDGKKAVSAPKNWPFGTQEKPADTAPVAEPTDPVIPGGEPLDFLQAVINETRLPLATRLQAAALAAPFKHAKLAPAGKKQQVADDAKKAGGTSKFKAAQPPRLVSSR